MGVLEGRIGARLKANLGWMPQCFLDAVASSLWAWPIYATVGAEEQWSGEGDAPAGCHVGLSPSCSPAARPPNPRAIALNGHRMAWVCGLAAELDLQHLQLDYQQQRFCNVRNEYVSRGLVAVKHHAFNMWWRNVMRAWGCNMRLDNEALTASVTELTDELNNSERSAKLYGTNAKHWTSVSSLGLGPRLYGTNAKPLDESRAVAQVVVVVCCPQ